jgi:hypothetical protein
MWLCSIGRAEIENRQMILTMVQIDGSRRIR